MADKRTKGSAKLGVQPVRRAYQQVADQLRALILEGRLVAGERLPTEPELAGLFGVGRSTVREALRLLSSQNLVKTSRGVGGGSYVANPGTDSITDFLEANLVLLTDTRTVSVEELLEARDLLEVPAARLAAERQTSSHIEAMRAALGDPDDIDRAHLFEGNRQFHVAVLAAAGNRFLEVMTAPVFTVLRSRFLRDAAPREFWIQVGHDHQGILEAIEAGHPEQAGDEMHQHLLHLRSTYEAIDRAQEPANE